MNKLACQICSLKIPMSRFYGVQLCSRCNFQITEELEDLEIVARRDQMLKDHIDSRWVLG